MKIARQRVSATKSGNGLQKTLQTISIWRWLLFILFFYFSVVLVVIREKSPEIRGFPRQPARQRDSNRGCNGRSFSEWKLHLFCDLHKTIHRFFRRVAGVRCRVFTLPALLSAIFGKHSWVREVPPAGNALVHNLVDFPDFPLLRLVKGMVQGFLVELLGADHAPGVLIKIRLYHPGFGVLRHKIPLVFFEIPLHGRAESQLEPAASVNLHSFCPHLLDIAS